MSSHVEYLLKPPCGIFNHYAIIFKIQICMPSSFAFHLKSFIFCILALASYIENPWVLNYPLGGW